MEIHQTLELIDNVNKLTFNIDGTISTDTNTLTLQADDGNVAINAVGAGNDITLTSADDITIDASSSASAAMDLKVGQAGTLTVRSVDNSSGGDTGAVTIKTGNNNVASRGCGDLTIAGGDATHASGGDGGDVSISGGDINNATSTVGAVTITGGNGLAASCWGGHVTIAGGTAGSGRSSNVILKAANAGAAVDYVTCNGALQQVELDKKLLCSAAAEFDAQVDFDADVDFNSTCAFSGTTTFDANGRLVFTEKTLEGSPSQGEVCQDTLHDTLAYYNGSFWQNAAGLVFNRTARSDAMSASASEEIFQASAADIYHTIPANSLRVGNIFRVRGAFYFDQNGSNAAVQIKMYVGDAVNTSQELLGSVTIPSDSGDGYATFTADLVVRAIGGSGELIVHGTGSTYKNTVNTAYAFVDTYEPVVSIDTTGANYMFCSHYKEGGVSNDVYMEYFSIEII